MPVVEKRLPVQFLTLTASLSSIGKGGRNGVVTLSQTFSQRHVMVLNGLAVVNILRERERERESLPLRQEETKPKNINHTACISMF